MKRKGKDTADRFTIEDAIMAWAAETQPWDWDGDEQDIEDYYAHLAKDQVEEYCEWLFGKVREWKTGHWFTVEHEYASCSECGGDIFTDWPTTKEAKEKVRTFHEKYRYCPFCGARMGEPNG